MRLRPRSLAGRLLVTAALGIAVALAIAALAIGHVLERFVTENLDARLDAQIAVVARAVRPDGSLDPRRAVDVPPFDQRGSGWVWQVDAPGGRLGSASLDGAALPLPDRPPPPFWGDDPGRPRPFEALDPGNGWLHGRVLLLPTARGEARLAAAGPRWVVERPLRAAWPPLLASLAAIGAALAVAVLVQLRLGLRPLGRLRRDLAEVRAGRRDRIAADEPSELQPLVAELNALIAANSAALDRARGHVANLAHGLKTPLAAMQLDLAGRDPDGRLAAQVDRMEAQVRHHLACARSVEADARSPALPLSDHVAGLVAALDRIHADRAIAAEVVVPPDLRVRCDPQDLDELLGNLLDNAWRHARHGVTIAVRDEGRLVSLAIVDDGPGMEAAERARRTTGAIRVDEQADGHGFGLRIARELVELHGGALSLDAASGGGLCATLTFQRG